MTQHCKLLEKPALKDEKQTLSDNSLSGQQKRTNLLSKQQIDIDKALEDKLERSPIREILTKREIQILEFIIEGKTNKEIAQKLFRTQRTIEYHRNRLMRKLDTHTTAELVKRAILTGFA